MQQLTYLAINCATVAFPFIFSFWVRPSFFQKWHRMVRSCMLVGIPFILWDIFFTRIGVWHFNPSYVVGITLFGLPIEEILFFVAIPFACLFLLHLVQQHGKEQRVPGTLFWLVLFVFAVILFIVGAGKLYTETVSLILIVLSIWAMRSKHEVFSRASFWTYMGLSVLGFLLVNSVLTALPVVVYNPDHMIGVRIGAIPIEDLAYLIIMQVGFGVVFVESKHVH